MLQDSVLSPPGLNLLDDETLASSYKSKDNIKANKIRKLCCVAEARMVSVFRARNSKIFFNKMKFFLLLSYTHLNVKNRIMRNEQELAYIKPPTKFCFKQIFWVLRNLLYLNRKKNYSMKILSFWCSVTFSCDVIAPRSI